MSSHLGVGSKDVPLQKGKIRLYSMRFCPYAHRVHLVLNAKKIPHDIVYINLKNKPEWYLEKYPLGKVPSIIVDDTFICESLIISDLLDEKYPENLLYPNDPLKKAKDRMMIDAFGRIISPLYQCYSSPVMDSGLLDPVFTQMDSFEEELYSRGTPLFFGDKPGMVDYMIWPWWEKFETLKIMGGDNFRIPEDRFPRLVKWSKIMKEDEAVKKHYVSPEQHAKVLLSYRAGNLDYDCI